MNKLSAKRTKRTCYFTYLAMSTVFSLPPLLFAALREIYSISYTLLGTLVLVNFITQLGIDLVFSFFTKHFNIRKTIRIMPLLTSLGLVIYALIPLLFPAYAYIGLVAGTFIFSVAAGLSEVLVSPTVAALPSDTPESDMSTLHSLYGYGYVGVVVISTLFLQFVGKEYWIYLTFFWASLPVIASILLFRSQIPDMNMEKNEQAGTHSRHRTISLLLCMACIFLGSASENTMSNWVSVYTENALHMPKVWGDIFGMAMFAILLALTRTLYAKYGKNIFKALLFSMSGAIVCYIAAALSPNAILSLIACVLTGICTSMLWPGTLILMEEKVPNVGVAAYALMAAGGDFGASFSPQVLGIVVDNISLSEWAQSISQSLSLTSEQVGFKSGILLASLMPIMGTILLLFMKHYFKRHE
ncbi:MAG: MFS transporter [Clostridia bacterium]|nr:MFS transporter [Clostridia bacterium]